MQKLIMDMLISLLAGTVIYYILSLYAFYERGYKAYGGECLAALAAGFFIFCYLRGYLGKGKL